MQITINLTIDTTDINQLEGFIQFLQRLKINPIIKIADTSKVEIAEDIPPIEIITHAENNAIESKPNLIPEEEEEEEETEIEPTTRKWYSEDEKELIWDLSVNQHKPPKAIGKQVHRKGNSISQLLYTLRKQNFQPRTKLEKTGLESDDIMEREIAAEKIISGDSEPADQAPKVATKVIQYKCEKCGEIVHAPVWIRGKAYHEKCAMHVH
jgi:hypothetical protein